MDNLHKLTADIGGKTNGRVTRSGLQWLYGSRLAHPAVMLSAAAISCANHAGCAAFAGVAATPSSADDPRGRRQTTFPSASRRRLCSMASHTLIA